MKRYLFLLVAVILLPMSIFAQGTTSGAIEGTIVDVDGTPLAGANVVAIHKPSGTQYGTASRSNGGFTIKGVRVGGPYQINVTFIGFNPRKRKIDNIELGETAEIHITLEEGELALDEISVTAKVNPLFNANKTGAGTNISQQEIESTPTLSRSLQDFTRLNPMSTGGGSFGGVNRRYNNILIDGSTLNDVFGLAEGTPGSSAGVESPISIDAIKEFNVDIAPFDVTNNGFTGGQINAITKSGTNEFTGSAYYQLRNENLVGNFEDNDGNISDDYSSFDEQFFGLNIGGPIIKDELFFFANVELKRRSSPITTGIMGSNASNIFGIKEERFERIREIAKKQYGYDTGGFRDRLKKNQDNDKVLAKIDWNINEDHKLSVRYNYVSAVDEQGRFRDANSYSFSNRGYNYNSTQNSIVAELNSSFGNNASNTFRAVYTRIRDNRDPQVEAFPEVEIRLPYDSERSGTGSIYMGIDRFSQTNVLNQDLIEITDNFTYFMGDHELTLGTSNQIFSFMNKFVQDDYGSYIFDSIEDFKNGIPFRYRYSYLMEGGNASAEFTGLQLGFYAQDKWKATDNLTLTLGLRADIPIFPDEPTYNKHVEEEFGRSTSRVASGNVLWSPRFGFNWDVVGDRSTQIRGGAGIFSGKPPFVWLSNQYSNTGADYGRIDIREGETDAFGPGFFNPDPENQPSPLDQGSTLEGIKTSAVNLIAEDFKYPQALKVDLAIDQELPFGIVGTLEGVYSKMINEIKYENINLAKRKESAHGRPLYGDFDEGGQFATGIPNRVAPEYFTNALLLKNASEGYQFDISGQLKKQFDFGLNATLAYTYNHAETVNNGTSSRAISNWYKTAIVDVNDSGIGIANYQQKHRILGQLSYQFSWARRFITTISLIYDGHSGGPVSWAYIGDANGEGRLGNDLIYVPESKDEVILVDNNWNEFDQWIESHESLNKYRGDFVERGSAQQPWANFLDMRINQQIKTFNGQNVEITASLFNVLNFLNKEWGTKKSLNGSYNIYEAVYFQGYENGKPKIKFDPATVSDSQMYSIDDLNSRWQLQIGLRYNF